MNVSVSIAQKIWLTLLILIAGYSLSVGFGFFLGGNTEKRLAHVSGTLFTASVESRAAVSAFDEQIRSYQDMVMIGNMGTVAESAAQKAGEVQSSLKKILDLQGIRKEKLQETEEIRKEMEIFSETALNLYQKMGAETDFVFGEADEGESGAGENMPEENTAEEIFRIGRQSNALAEKLSLLAQGFSDDLKQELAGIGNVTHDYRFLNLFLFFGIVLLAGSLAGLIISRSITRPLKKLIRSLSDSSGDMLFTAEQGSEAGNALAERSFQQAASIEEVSASLEEMSSMTKLNADNAEKTREIVENALGLIRDTDRFMTELTLSMKEITAASKETSHIVKTIDEIAFQTNLLSLNAAVEAARAGDAGAGFAVVAGEVRNLALRSAQAAKNTSALIEGNVKKIAEGEKLTSETIGVFRSVAKGAENIRALIGEMTSASEHQALGIEDVNRAITEMDRATQSNAGSAEDAAVLSRQMNARAVQMKALVDDLTGMAGERNGKQPEHRKNSGNHKTAGIKTAAYPVHSYSLRSLKA